MLLKETGKNKIADVTAMMNIDIRSPGFWQNSLNLVKQDIEKFIIAAGGCHAST